MDDDYSIPTSSGLTRPKKSAMEEEEIMELRWQNGQVVMQSQNQRSLKKSYIGNGSGGSGDAVIPSDQAAGREIRHVEETTQHHLFMQEDEMTTWLHYPLDDPSFERDLYSDYTNTDLLYPTPSSTVTTATLPRESRTSTEEIRPPPPQLSPAAPIVTAPRPPIPPPKRLVTESSNRFQNFGHFSRLPRTRLEPSPANLSKAPRDSTVVDSNETPISGQESRVSNVADNVVPVSGRNLGCSTISGTGTATTSTAIREPAHTCELSMTSSPGGSGNSISASAEPPAPAPSHKAAAVAATPTTAGADDLKRKVSETEDGEGQNERSQVRVLGMEKLLVGIATPRMGSYSVVIRISQAPIRVSDTRGLVGFQCGYRTPEVSGLNSGYGKILGSERYLRMGPTLCEFGLVGLQCGGRRRRWLFVTASVVAIMGEERETTSILAAGRPCVFTDMRKRSGVVKAPLTVHDGVCGGDSGRGTRNDVDLGDWLPLRVHRCEEKEWSSERR
ncbi:putative protein YIF1B-B-like [Capsicum annuum]|nr:putative protein YIF1B-B-like [Capsicum annuum]